jgi:stage V sporulation protein R
MVMAHVTGHVDFFKHNMWFAHTNRKMLDAMANHATRIQRIIDRIGYDIVEEFIDVCLSLENLIDYHAPYIKRPESQSYQPVVGEEDPITVEGLRVERDYMRDYINPPEYLADQRRKAEEERAKQRRFPENPQKDILLFLMNYAPLERWQHTVLEIIRDEAYYFAPQGMTKTLNEGWACITSSQRVLTHSGFLTIKDIVSKRLYTSVADGVGAQQIYDWIKFEDYPIIKIRTRRGLELEGSYNHRLMLTDGSWRRLDELAPGDTLKLSVGQNIWSNAYVELHWRPSRRPMWTQADEERLSARRSAAVIGDAVTKITPDVWNSTVTLSTAAKRSQPIRIPEVVDEDLGAFLGYLCGDGHISAVKRTIGFTSGDEDQADRFVQLVWSLFRLQTRKRWDPNRWRVSFSALDVQEFLQHLGMKTGISAREKTIPEVILRSPKPVVAAFLRALYDCDGYAGSEGVILATSSAEMSKLVQLLLLNFGIMSTRRPHKDGCWHVHTTGASCAHFLAQIGFELARKQAALAAYIESRRWFKREAWTDEVVSIEHGRGDVYDISVTETHRYVAQGFINHNSYWHSTIMTQKAASAAEIVSFADLHSGVVATSSGRYNPYKVGLELLRDVEDRWNKGKFGKEYDECDDIAEKRNWDKQLGLGRQKIFEIRRLYNDVTFIDEFLTPEFVVENKLFTFRYNRDTDLYEIASREFKEIKEKLLFRLTNFGQPFIYVEDGNYNNRGEMYLRHRHEGVDLKMDYARDTMRNLYKIWTRPIHLETLIDDKKRLLSFDGSDFTERRID